MSAGSQGGSSDPSRSSAAHSARLATTPPLGSQMPAMLFEVTPSTTAAMPPATTKPSSLSAGSPFLPTVLASMTSIMPHHTAEKPAGRARVRPAQSTDLRDSTMSIAASLGRIASITTAANSPASRNAHR